MKTQHHCFWIGGTKFFHDPGPHSSGRTEFGHFFKQIIMRIKKERETFAKYINIQAFFQCCFHISFSIAEGKSNFLYGRAACFPDMITRNGNGIPLWQFIAAPFKNIGDDAHGRFGRIDIGSPGGIFFQDIILNRARDFFQIGALLFCQCNIQSQQNKPVALIVMEVVTSSSLIPLNNVCISSMTVNGNTYFSHFTFG